MAPPETSSNTQQVGDEVEQALLHQFMPPLSATQRQTRMTARPNFDAVPANDGDQSTRVNGKTREQFQAEMLEFNEQMFQLGHEVVSSNDVPQDSQHNDGVDEWDNWIND
jgi:hypothetical protein